MLYSFTRALARPLKPMGEWNTLEITLAGDRVRTTINGVEVAEFDPAGPIPERKSTGDSSNPLRSLRCRNSPPISASSFRK